MDNLLDSRERFISKSLSYSSPLTKFWNIYVKLYSDAHLYYFPREASPQKQKGAVLFHFLLFFI